MLWASPLRNHQLPGLDRRISVATQQWPDRVETPQPTRVMFAVPMSEESRSV